MNPARLRITRRRGGSPSSSGERWYRSQLSKASVPYEITQKGQESRLDRLFSYPLTREGVQSSAVAGLLASQRTQWAKLRAE